MNHNHNNQPHQPAITHGWKRATVLGNLVLGSAELLTGNLSSLAVAADGVHNVGDAVTYKLQADDVLQAHDDHQLQRRRKAAHWIIATTSAVVAAKAGYDLTAGVEHSASDFSLVAASASLVYNGALFYGLRRGTKQAHKELDDPAACAREKDLTKHFLVLDIPSAALAVGGAWVQRQGYADAEQVAALSSGLLGVIAFRPTAANLEHQH